MSDGIAIDARGLTRRFGVLTAVDGLDLSVPTGSVFGFLGRNGAGKSVTIRMLLGLSRITAGSARVAGHPVSLHDTEIRRRVGYLPDKPGTYEWMSGRENVLYAAGLFGLSGKAARSGAKQLLESVGLTEAADRRAGGYSAGMRQRLGLAQALINDPQILIMDEPTSALDPLGRVEVLELISTLRERATTIFMSTHLLDDVERVCDTIAIIDEGKLITQSSVEELKRKHAVHAVEIELEADVPGLPARIEALNCVERVELITGASGPSIRVHLSEWSDECRKATMSAVSDHAGVVRSYHSVLPSLENVFVSLVGHGLEHPGEER